MTTIHNTPNYSRIDAALKLEAHRVFKRRDESLRALYFANKQDYLTRCWPKDGGEIPTTKPELVAKLGWLVNRWKQNRERSPNAHIHPLVDPMNKIVAALQFELEAE